jgi:diguanylate cyclase (GGDEF)-like protein/PAS domain S-box-containing protein
MQTSQAIDDDERARLCALQEYALLDGPPDPVFDSVVQLAAQLLDAPIAAVSLVDQDRQWFAAKVGLEAPQTDRSVAFCSHAILDDALLLVPNAARDQRFADNPLVTGAPGIRFYAGVPLKVGSGHRLGTLCVIDTKPRSQPKPEALAALKTLARLIVERIETRRESLVSRRASSRFDSLFRASPSAAICADADGRIVAWNTAAASLFGHSAAEAIGQPLELIVPPHLREAHGHGLSRAARSGQSHLAGKAVEILGLHRDGREIPIELSLSMWREDGLPVFGAIARDISDRCEAQAKLQRMAHFDELTGLPNRASFRERLRTIVEVNRAPCGVLLIDLDGFKLVNDSLGHTVGDQLLVEAGHRLRAAAGESAFVSRLGGDEFAILREGARAEELLRLAERSCAALGAPYSCARGRAAIGASIGLAISPDHGSTVEQLLSAADLALYQAKGAGGRRVERYVPALQQAMEARLLLEADLRRALACDEFELHYQPQVRLGDGKLEGAEALLRWHHPQRGLLAPALFLDVLETSPIAVDVGTWVLMTACRDAAQWCTSRPGLTVGVNLFSAQLRAGSLYGVVNDALCLSGLPAEQLELEITENSVLHQHDEAATALTALRNRGVGVAFDDFGTGFASLSLLKRYPVSRIKIDRGFVSDIGASSSDEAIVGAVIAMASSLGLSTIAEGIESPAEAELLSRLGCEGGQGFLYGRPMSNSAFASALEGRAAA